MNIMYLKYHQLCVTLDNKIMDETSLETLYFFGLKKRCIFDILIGPQSESLISADKTRRPIHVFIIYDVTSLRFEL